MLSSLLMPKQGLSVREPQTTRLTGRLAFVSNLLLVFSSFQMLLMVPVAGGADLADFTPQGVASFLTGGHLPIDHLLHPLLLLLLPLLLLLLTMLQVNMGSQQLVARTPVRIF